MDFFAAQEQSRRRTRWLVIAYLIATVAVVAAVTAIFSTVWLWSEISPIRPDAAWLSNRWQSLALIAAGTLAVIGLASLFRIFSLRGGGSRVAHDLGGTSVSPDTSDPLRRRLRNVVEEMAIASGVPVPEIFVLEQEAAINAFAAGYQAEDAAVAVTRGALEQLNRDELQGVIGHEFSHILNGDMRLNIRMLGPLFGIMIIGFVGRSIMHNSRLGRSAGSGSSSRGNGLVFIIALGLVIVGWVGVAAARIIKASVSRQREFLADASAVQFTRNPPGLAGALKKIGGLKDQSYLRRADSEEINHMLFASGAGLAGLFATHPPLGTRIERLDPSFTGSFVEAHSTAAEHGSAAGIAGIAAAQAHDDTSFGLDAEDVPAQAGNPDAGQIAAAHSLHRSIPPGIYQAAHDDEDSLLMALALVLHPDAKLREAQLHYLGQQLGPTRAANVAALQADIGGLGSHYRLPLLDLAFPAIKRRPDTQLEFLLKLVNHLVRIDNQIELFEYCLSRILDESLRRAQAPSYRAPRIREKVTAHGLRTAVLDLFAVLARHGHEDLNTAQAAYAAGLKNLGLASAGSLDEQARSDWQKSLDKALPVLARLRAKDRRRLVAALAVTASHDARITIAESELLRVVCAVVDCPLPPLYADDEAVA